MYALFKKIFVVVVCTVAVATADVVSMQQVDVLSVLQGNTSVASFMQGINNQNQATEAIGALQQVASNTDHEFLEWFASPLVQTPFNQLYQVLENFVPSHECQKTRVCQRRNCPSAKPDIRV